MRIRPGPTASRNCCRACWLRHSRIPANSRPWDANSSDLTPDDLLETELRDFEARYTEAGKPPMVVVRLVAKLVRMPVRHITGTILVTEKSAAAARDLDSIVEAFDTAVGLALTRIVNWTLLNMAHNRAS